MIVFVVDWPPPSIPIIFPEHEVKNVNHLGRIFNMVQHPSIAPPFLCVETHVDCNGKRGFTQGQRGCEEILWGAPLEFPAARTKEGVKDAQYMTGGDDDVFSYEVDPKDSYGWATGMQRYVLINHGKLENIIFLGVCYRCKHFPP